jgi:LacI family repressor for deo operon, udp, cdd, tsx, nupC, and nupG
MKIGLSDIARDLGISAASVSRALNGRPGVSPDLRERVMDAATAAGYVAPAMRAGKANDSGLSRPPLVGIIVPELTNPVFPAFASVMSTMLAEQGYLPVLCSQSEPGVSEDAWLALLTDSHAQGIIVVSGMHADTHASTQRYKELRDANVALALVNGHVPNVDASFVSVDEVGAVESAVQFLVELGHTRIGLALGPERFVPTIAKAEGYRRALRRHAADINPDTLIAHSTFSLEGGVVAANQLIDRDATAIICASDVMALGAIRAARARGMAVPRDLSIVGFDDSLLSAHIDPALTSLRQPIRAMATAAVSAVLEELRNGVHPTRELVFSAELIVRSSTAAAPRRAVDSTGRGGTTHL